MIDWKVFKFDEVESTNDIAKDFLAQQLKNFVVQADRQTSGRGRRGRKWISLEGNLFFSIGLDFELRNLGSLLQMCSLSLLDTIKSYDKDAFVQLKWPNDVLLNGAKVSGMLLEKGEGKAIVIGIGVNICHHPDNDQAMYETISLYDVGIKTDKEIFLKRFLDCLSFYLTEWPLNRLKIKQRWLDNVKGINSEIMIKQENTVLTGIFSGIDDDGDLLLKQSGEIKKIWAGDVFYIE